MNLLAVTNLTHPTTGGLTLDAPSLALSCHMSLDAISPLAVVVENLSPWCKEKGKQEFSPPSPSRPLVVPIEHSDGDAPCYDAKPTTKKPKSDGLSGCVTLHDLKDRFQLILDRDAAAAAAAAKADTESNMDSPEPLPAWMMTGETWEACKAEA